MSDHLSEAILIQLADGELDGSDALAAERHVSRCDVCRRQFEQLRSELASFDRYHQTSWKPSAPPPPRPWADLNPMFDRIRPSQPPRSPLRWVALAAGVVAAVIVIQQMALNPAGVSAARILARASSAEAAATRAHRNIRMKTRSRTIVRPAIYIREVPSPAEQQLRARFVAAKYPWEDPLSVHSYVSWREGLPQKEDEVVTRGKQYVIRTTTRSGPLVEATLALNSDNLQPVRGTLRFEPDEVVEMSETDEQPAAEPAPMIKPAQPLPAPGEPFEAGPEEELRVVSALHAIEADLGEPIEIHTGGARIRVTGTGLPEPRRQQLRDAMASMPFVDLEFTELERRSAGTTGRSTVAPDSTQHSPLFAELELRLGSRAAIDQFIDRALLASDGVLARVHAMRRLASRFPPDQLPERSQQTLAAIALDHERALVAHAGELHSLVSEALPSLALAPKPVPVEASWRASLDPLFHAASRLDETLNDLLAPGSDHAALTPKNLADAIGALERALPKVE